MVVKERYFTIQSLAQQAQEMYRQVAEPWQKNKIPFQPGKSALLVLDMQAYFFEPSSHAYIPSGEAILDGICQLINEYSTKGRPIIFSQHINTRSNAGMMAVWWKDLLTDHNPCHKIIPQIDVAKGIVVQKSQYDAFHQTRLVEILRDKNIRQVVICGVMTHLCCETTARSAFMQGFEVFFPVDGTATYNLAFHQASLTNLAHGFATVNFVKDILEEIRGWDEN